METNVIVDQKYTHPSDREALMKCAQVALFVAKQFAMPLRRVEHKRRPHPGGAGGLCYVSEGRISILIRYKEGPVWSKGRVSLDYMLDTAVHEVAHLDGLPDGKKHDLRTRVWVRWAKINHPELWNQHAA